MVALSTQDPRQVSQHHSDNIQSETSGDYGVSGNPSLYDGANVVADLSDHVGVLGVDRFYVTPYLDQNLSMTDASGTYWFSQDGLGSVRTVTDASGAVKNVYDYTAFGEAWAAGTSETVSQRYQFTAREHSSVSGLNYHRYRWDDPRIGRFITRDPIYYWGGTNLYCYVDNNPINSADALGLLGKEWTSPYRNAIYKAYILMVGGDCPDIAKTLLWHYLFGDGETAKLTYEGMKCITKSEPVNLWAKSYLNKTRSIEWEEAMKRNKKSEDCCTPLSGRILWGSHCQGIARFTIEYDGRLCWDPDQDLHTFYGIMQFSDRYDFEAEPTRPAPAAFQCFLMRNMYFFVGGVPAYAIYGEPGTPFEITSEVVDVKQTHKQKIAQW